ncbi:MAG: type I DNA topoisomerase [Candidatus Pacebacteria bacterium]|nr:type I DNA topoisomerase [Candidatus Paceibacterota bacterium]
MKSTKLLIVESPAKAKTIGKYLGSDFKVVASIGHVRDLPKSNKSAIDIAGGFIPHYVISPGKERVINEIKFLAKNASEVLLASDPDREGEAIAWHIKEAIGLKNPKRVVYHEITKEAILDAIAHPRAIDENLKTAQEARRVLDRLVGYDLSGLIWKKVRYGLSAGRVQSPALRIVMEREREIRAFNPVQYFVIQAEVETLTGGAGANKIGGEKMLLTCVKEPDNQKEAELIVEIAKKNNWHVLDIEESEAKRSPKAPFITSTIQQAASSRLGFSPSRTMGLAQKLYEAGHITYMRTDSTNLSKTAVADALRVIETQYGKEYVSPRSFASKSKNAQEAHEAIRPSHMGVEVAGNNDDEKKLYRLIRARTVASQMTDARIARTKIIANIKDDTSDASKSIPDFAVVGSRVIFDGWLKADPDARGEDVELPKVSAKDNLKLLDVVSTEKWTEPPSRYTEAGLVKELEKRGIGRPSTYASIIRTLEEREYVTKTNKSLVPTDTGDVVSSFLEQNFAEYISDSFTAEMEDKLDLIAEGKAEYVKTLKDFYGPFTKDIQEKDKMDKITNLGDADVKFVCPKCGSHMIVKLSRSGKFLSCSTYPVCTGALTINGEEIKSDTPLGHDPKTGLPIFVKVGKYGPYVQLGDKESLEKAISEGKDIGQDTVVEPAIETTTYSAGAEPTKVELTKAGKPKKVRVKKPKKATLKPRMASIPKGKDITAVTVDEAMVYLSLPRRLGTMPSTGKVITANVGRFGPYIVHDGDFRSLKGEDNPYTITLERALAILSEPKKVSTRGRWAKKKTEDTQK